MIQQTRSDDLLDDVIRIAGDAGDAILTVYQGDDIEVEQKADRTPLTEADMAAHRCIQAGLSRLVPEWPILSEESAEVPFEERRNWEVYWLVDPLDGTREFIKRNGEFTVNIALIDNGVPVLGVVYAPVLDTFYYGSLARGAFKQENDNPAREIHVTSDAPRPLRIAGSRSHSSERMVAFLDSLGEHQIRAMGSSLKCCLVAEGEADLYPRIGPTSEWDTAAAQAVVEAAGGQVTDAHMDPLRYNRKASLLNPDFFVFGDRSLDWASNLADPVLER